MMGPPEILITPVVLLFVLVLILIAGGVVVAVAMGRKRLPPDASSTSRPSYEERVQHLQRKKGRYMEEQSRLLGMVEEKKITGEEADRLLDTLERETTTMNCPFCAEEIRIEAAKCKHCKQYLLETSVTQQPLTKSSDRVLSGVCGGLADHANLDPTLIRILATLLILSTGIVIGLIAYFVAAFIMPEPQTA